LAPVHMQGRSRSKMPVHFTSTKLAKHAEFKLGIPTVVARLQLFKKAQNHLKPKSICVLAARSFD